MALKRRTLLRGSGGLLSGLALGSLLRPAGAQPHFAPIAKRVVFLSQAGAPSQLETFDYKPGLAERDGSELPRSVRGDQRLTTMSSGQSAFPVVAPRVGFERHPETGTWVSDLLPRTRAIADRLCVIRTLHTEQINHEPAMTFLQTGHALPGRPSLGAWLSHGWAEASEELPRFTVLTSRSAAQRAPQPISPRLWGAGFLPPETQGTLFRSGPSPVLYAREPYDATAAERERLHRARSDLDRLAGGELPQVNARIRNFELAHRMQASVPEVADLSEESESSYRLYGEAARTPGTYAYNCLLARRLLERGVPFVQLYHRDWDHHATMMTDHPLLARDTDRASAALVLDLEQRGLLEDTLVVWAGEFGRTVYAQGRVSREQFGRDHHGRCFSIWLAGAGIRGGHVHGETDDFAYNIARDPVSVHDLHATLLELLGFDHTRLTYRFQGRDFRLTDTEGRILRPILA